VRGTIAPAVKRSSHREPAQHHDQNTEEYVCNTYVTKTAAFIREYRRGRIAQPPVSTLALLRRGAGGGEWQRSQRLESTHACAMDAASQAPPSSSAAAPPPLMPLKLLLITANVSGVFESLSAALPQWIEQLECLVATHAADFVAIHMQVRAQSLQ